MKLIFFFFHLSIVVPFLSYGQNSSVDRKIEILKIKSDIIKDEYDILISYPENYNSIEVKLPVLYILDPDYYYLQFVLSYDSLEKIGLVPKALIIGVGYSCNFNQRAYRVLRDLTPTQLVKTEYNADVTLIPKDSTDRYSGKSDSFIKFLQSELIPYVDSNLKSDSNNRFVFGNGYGGLFLCYLLHKQPDLFHSYNISSPYLWWDKELLVRNKNQNSKNKANVFFSYGEKEDKKITTSCKRYVSTIEDNGLINKVYKSKNSYTVIRPAFNDGFIYLSSKK